MVRLNKGVPYMQWKRAFVAALTLAATAMPAMAGEGKFSAMVFGDAYWMAANHDSTIEDMNGLWIRRFNLTWDQKFDDTWSGRMRLEATQPGDFSTSGTIPAFIKDAWLKWQGGGHSALIGIQPSPTMPLYEDTWGYRSVEKVPVELQGLGTTRDGGIALVGDFGENKTVGYHVMVGNGTHVNAETNTKKKGMASLRIHAGENLVLEAYGDYEDRIDSADRYLYFGFAGYQSEGTRAGLQYAQQTRLKNEDTAEYDLRILSGFFTKGLSEKTWILVRVDRNMDPNPGGESIQYMPFADTAANTFFIAGVDFTVAEGVNFIPNVEATMYDDPEAGGEAPDADVMVRLTFQGKF
jgi:hypothetical protein